MFLRAHKSLSSALLSGLFAAAAVACVPMGQAQVFVVGAKSATADVPTDFTPTKFPLPEGRLDERGRRDLVRNLESEQGFAHRPLPAGAGLSLEANGPLSPGPDQYRKMLYEKGQAVGVGDRVVVTALVFKGDRIVIDLNGGPYAKHRFLSHVSLGDNPIAQDTGHAATGSRVTLIFKDGIPEISAPEVKALLTPVIDFGAKTSAEAFAETLPTPIKEAIAGHEVLVGMDRRMVLAALGAPESKVREHEDSDPDSPRYEEWIYGHVPQTVKFVRFHGDRVEMVKIAALGKPIEIHNTDEMGGYLEPLPTRQIALGDTQPGDDSHPAKPPTLRQPGDAVPVNQPNQVRYPVGMAPPDAAPQRIPPTPGTTGIPQTPPT